MKQIIIVIAILALTGCAEKSRFDCPYGKGPSCISMDQIDKNIKSGDQPKCSKAGCAKSNIKDAGVTFPIQTNPNPALRVPEQVMQMWIAPYEAKNGIYYQQAYVNIIVKEASWQAPVLDDASVREEYNG